MMQASTLRPVMGASIALFMFFVMSAATSQSAPATAGYGPRAQTGDASFNVGWSELTNDGAGGSRTATLYGGSVGYNPTHHLAALGEFQYAHHGTLDGIPASGKLYGGLLRYSFLTGRVAPYLLLGGGGIRESGGSYGPHLNADGWYAAFGGGASFFLTRHWGVRPEFRYNRESLQVGTASTGGDLYQVTGGVFFQFGKGVPEPSREPASGFRNR